MGGHARADVSRHSPIGPALKPADLQRRIAERVEAWALRVEETRETETSVLLFGTRDGEAYVGKVIKARDDEWQSGRVLGAFGGAGMVRVVDYIDGAMLLERVSPGDSLAPMAMAGDDEEATRILASVIGKFAPAMPPEGTPTLAYRAEAFDWYASSGDTQIDRALFRRARAEFTALACSQRNVRLLHGDLHHYNVLRDERRGWIAIDPKGVTGELEYEIGAALRNPCERIELLADAATFDRRVACFAQTLGLDRARIVRWAFAQAVLAAIWEVQERARVEPDNPWLTLARAIEHRAVC
jgi:streptomycin 6-kinase